MVLKSISQTDNQFIISIDSLGDDALFIGHSYTCCLSTRDYPKLLPGHVYFTDDDEYWLFEYKNIRRDVGIYNLEDDTSLDVVSSQPWLNWPNPIWITPSFTKINQQVRNFTVTFCFFWQLKNNQFHLNVASLFFLIICLLVTEEAFFVFMCHARSIILK